MAKRKKKEQTGPTHPAGTDTEADRRIEVILDQLAGRCSCRAAAMKLGVGEARYYQLRAAFFAGAREALTPRPAGRPAKAAPHPVEEDAAKLRAENSQLKLELECSSVREAIALAMPEYVANTPHKAKAGPVTHPEAKAKAQKTNNKPKRRKKGGSSGHR